ncbi:MAG TPA: BON domain-containing protein [Geminicoccaceae bacterium]
MRPAHALTASIRRLGWLTGLPALALIAAGAIHLGTPRIEEPLALAASRIAAEIREPSAEPWLHSDIRGRDLVAKGEAPSTEARTEALARLAALPGLHRLTNEIGFVEEASPFTWSATRIGADRIALSGSRPAEIGPAALAAALAPALPPGARLDDASRRARGAPPDFQAAAAYGLARLAELLPGAVATISDTTFSFIGEAASVADYDRFRTALGQPPHGYTLATVEVLPAKVDDFRFSVTRERGGPVVLTGNVVSEAARAEIRALASEAADGAPVEDRTRTARGLDAAIDPAALTRFVFQVAGLMQDGSVDLAGATLSAAGTALDRQAVKEIGALIQAGRPAGTGEGPVSLVARPLSPYKVSIRREAETVTLSGHLPDEKARERLLASLRPRFFHERIVDRLRIAEGAPAELARVLDLALGPLSTLASGEIAIADRSVRLTGESLYRESGRRIEAELARRFPPDWQSSVAVRAPGATEPREPESCAAAFGDMVQGRSLRFAPGSGGLAPEFYPVLDALAALAKACPALRIEVTGHTDPAGAAAPVAAKPVLDTALVESTASVDTASAAPKPNVEPAKAAPAAKPAAKKADEPKAGSKAAAKPDNTAKAPAPPAPEPDLPRQRALAIVDYLMKAGIPADRVAASAGNPQSERQGVGFALRS